MTAAVGAEPADLVVDQQEGVSGGCKLPIVLCLFKHVGAVVERGELKAVARGEQRAFLIGKDDVFRADVVSAFLGHDVGLVLILCFRLPQTQTAVIAQIASRRACWHS